MLHFNFYILYRYGCFTKLRRALIFFSSQKIYIFIKSKEAESIEIAMSTVGASQSEGTIKIVRIGPMA